MMLLLPNVFAQTLSEQIIIDQFGWYNDSRKIVIFADPIDGQNSSAGPYTPGSMFRVRRASDNATVYSNTITVWNSGNKDLQSGDIVWWGDFSALTTPGEYYIYDQANDMKSYDFTIGDKIYKDVLMSAVRMFFYQRCGTNISATHGGDWNHAVCHSQDANAELYDGGPQGNPRDVHGGWHDAGDFNKYIPFLDNTMWELMMAYELSPDKFGDDYNIPESGNNVPDIVDEIKYELDWMMRVQMPDGSVANRVAANSGEDYPQDDGATRYYTLPTTWSTATFAAILAHASRLFQNFQAEYGTYYQTLLEKATNAWNYLEAQPTIYPADGDDGGCGTLGTPACAASDANGDKRRRVFASAELFRTTGQAKYHEYFTNNCNDYAGTADGGHHPLEDGYFDACNASSLNQAFVMYAQTPGAKPGIVNQIRNSLKNALDWFHVTYHNNGSDAYRSFMWDGHYTWGSSQIKARWGNVLIYGIALGVSPADNALYREIAEEYLHYFHGRNPLSWVYMTGMTDYGGDKCVTEIYHSWFHDGSALYDGVGSTYGPAPGFIPGGPNQFFVRNISPPKGEPMQKAYRDWNTSWPEDSWEITEPAIYYQSAYVLLLSYCATFSRITVTNFSVTPTLITNDIPRTVQFLATVTTSSGNITTATLNLNLLDGTKVEMTNIGGDDWRYTYTIPAGVASGEHDIDITAYDDLGSVGLGYTMIIVTSSAYFPSLVIYDGGDRGTDTDFLYGWHWPSVSFDDVSASPKFGSYCGRLIMTNNPSGIAHVRDNTWVGIDCREADRLALWVKGTEKLPGNESVAIDLYSFTTNLGKSASVEISLTTNWRKVDIDIAALTNGADALFTMENIVGIEFSCATWTGPGTIVYFDDIILTTRVIVSNENINPDLVDRTTGTSVDFTCTVKALGNISKVTLDLSSLGGGYGKVEMTDLGGGDYDYTQMISAGTVSVGVYVLPIIAHDMSGSIGIGKVVLSVETPKIAIIEVVYDGETPQTDANWECWWPTASDGITRSGSIFFDQSGELYEDTQSACFNNFTNVHSGGVHVPEPFWWNGVDVSGADTFEFYFRAANGVQIELNLFSYDPINGVQYGTPLPLTGTGGWVPIATDMSYFTNGLVNFKRFVGIQLAANPGVVAYFDNMWFTANVVVDEEYVTPTLITNTHDNTIQFFARARTANLQITNVYIDLSLLGGPANAVMTNQSGFTLFRYTFTVASNQEMGNYVIPITAYDDAGFSGTGEAQITVTGRTPYTVAIVYDGDIISANPEQWDPFPPPMTAFFYDVDNATTAPHGGNYCGRFEDTNGGTLIYHRRDPNWVGIDVTAANQVEIWAKGSTGVEAVDITFVFVNPSGAAVYANSTNLSLSQNWGQWLFDVSFLTNGNPSAGSNLSRLIGMEISGVAKDSVIYLDDIKFVSYVDVRNEKATPNLADKDKDTLVMFSCDVSTINNNITSVTLDLTPINGIKVAMTNTTGYTSYGYAFTVQSNFSLSPGLRELRIQAIDDEGVISYGTIDLIIYSAQMEIMWDFELTVPDGTTSYAEGWRVDWELNLTPDSICPTDAFEATNLSFDGPVANKQGPSYNGSWSIGWDLNMNLKATGGAEAYITGGLNDNVNNGENSGQPCNHNGPDLSGYFGLIMWLWVDDVPGYDVEDPMIAYVNVQSPGWGDWDEGVKVTLLPGRWNKVWMDFDRCWDANERWFNSHSFGGTKEIGWTIRGAFGSYGVTKIYMDTVVSMDIVDPGAPTGLTVTDPGTGGALVLSWGVTGEKDVERYNIYQSTINDSGTAQFIASTPAKKSLTSFPTNAFLDKGVWNGTTYYYWISAVDISENEGPLSAGASAVPTGPMPTVSYPYKGVTLIANPGDLPGDLITELSNMKVAGVNTVGVIVTWFMSSGSDDNIVSVPANTLSDNDLIYVITNIHNMGMKVMLHPRIEVTDGTPRHLISHSDDTAWFDSYDTFIMKYATIASQYNVGLFVVGSELHSVTLDTNDSQWVTVISNVRTKFTNSITYAARWGSGEYDMGFLNRRIPISYDRPTYRNLCVWDDVDFIGINAYYPLDYSPSPPLSTLYWRWNNYYATNDLEVATATNHELWFVSFLYEWFDNIQNWRNNNYPGKDVIFTEIGYPSRDYAADTPWFKEDTGVYNGDLQRDCYEAAFRRIWDQDWMKGTFWYYWRPATTVPPNTYYTPQDKPAYDVIKWWYSIQPHHFAIKHDGAGEAMSWVPISIEVHQSDCSLVELYGGTITLDISIGTPGAISWTNLSGCGTLDDWGAGTAKAVYTFDPFCNNGIVTLGIKDNSMETVNVEVESGFITEPDDISEDANMIFSGPLSHFVVIHDGWGMKNTPKNITVQAIDVYGTVKIDYKGLITLYTVGEKGEITWSTNGTGATGVFNDGGPGVNWATYEPGPGETGSMVFKIMDNSRDTIDVEVIDGRGYRDDEVYDIWDPLIFVDFDHFAVYHSPTALIGFDEKVTIKAEDNANNPVFGVSGNITISFDTSITGPPSGSISFSIANGFGTLISLGSNKWVYDMSLLDNGVAEFIISDDTGDTIDIKATDGSHNDNNIAPRYLVFMSHIYHYVSKNNATPLSPYVTPDDAANDIKQAWLVSSPGDVILIIDNETYPEFYLLSGADGGEVMRKDRTLAGAATNRPTIIGNGTPAISFEYDFWVDVERCTFMNLRLVGINASAVVIDGGADVEGDCTFINCIISNTGGFPGLNLSCGNNGSTPYHVRYCKFIGDGGDTAINSCPWGSDFIGNEI